GAEEEPRLRLGDVERLDPEAIAAEHQTVAPRVPQGKGEHPLQARREIGSLLLVEVDDALDVAPRPEAVAAALEAGAQHRVVVDLAVAHPRHAAALVADGLVAARHVDDREPPHPEAGLGVDERAEIVRAAVHHDVAHGADALGARTVTARESQLSCDPTHGYATRDCVSGRVGQRECCPVYRANVVPRPAEPARQTLRRSGTGARRGGWRRLRRRDALWRRRSHRLRFFSESDDLEGWRQLADGGEAGCHADARE